MGLHRYVNTDFWSDPWILDLNSDEKLVFLYLLTNDKANMLGAYELSLKVAEFELGIPKDQLVTILAKFEEKGKIIFNDGLLIIINWAKNQKYNKNMLKNAYQSFEKLRDEQKAMIPKSVISQFQKLNTLQD